MGELKEGKKAYKAFIRVVKTLVNREFGTETVVKEPLMYGIDKSDIKSQLLQMYPQFFQNNKVYEKETKDSAQFFYVLIYELDKYDIQAIEAGEWVCANCGQVHENTYLSRPYVSNRLFGEDLMFCKNSAEYVSSQCFEQYKKSKFSNVELSDDVEYITKDSLNYIYKITEKSTNKSYIGKTKNAPFFRWWNHLTKSSSPFGTYLRTTKLSEWTFEVLEELPSNTLESEVFKIESQYMLKYDSVKNGFNTMVSNKSVIVAESENDNQLEIEFQ